MNYIEAMEEQIRNDLRLIRRHEEFKEAHIAGRYGNAIVLPTARSRKCFQYEGLVNYNLSGIDIDWEKTYETTESSIDDLFDTSKGLTGLKELIVKPPYPKDIESFIRYMAELRPNLFEVSDANGDLLATFANAQNRHVIDSVSGNVNYVFLETLTGGHTRFANYDSNIFRLTVEDYREFEKILLKIADFVESFK